MIIKVAQANDRIVIKIKNGRDIEISFFASMDQDAPSLCTIASDGRENTRYETRKYGKLEFWDFNMPDK